MVYRQDHSCPGSQSRERTQLTEHRRLATISVLIGVGEVVDASRRSFIANSLIRAPPWQEWLDRDRNHEQYLFSGSSVLRADYPQDQRKTRIN